jgi:hypothetical protein
MAFVYSHSVFGSCLQRFTSHCQVSPMTRCIRSAVSAHPTVNSVSLYEFMGLMLPSMRAVYLRLRYLLRCVDPTSPQLIRDEFNNHRDRSPWFAACLRSLSRLLTRFRLPFQMTNMQFLLPMALLSLTSTRVLALLAGAIFCSSMALRIALVVLLVTPPRTTPRPWPFFMDFYIAIVSKLLSSISAPTTRRARTFSTVLSFQKIWAASAFIWSCRVSHLRFSLIKSSLIRLLLIETF